jgi:hypothetical protein
VQKIQRTLKNSINRKREKKDIEETFPFVITRRKRREDEQVREKEKLAESGPTTDDQFTRFCI